MNFAAYIERQKSLIRHRHDGEVYLVRKDENVPLDKCGELLSELESLKGFNKRERMNLRREVV
ncbi:MAG: hypothetical protein K2L67_00465 [Clostridia bacterium]|nr:hypothetical protein [Clostridia bacterium]